jgi:outer membrane beta-barrel protein
MRASLHPEARPAQTDWLVFGGAALRGVSLDVMLALVAAAVLSQSQPETNSDDVSLHVVERKEFTDRGRFEITLFPAAVQVNGKFTQHVGGALAATYHLHENFALTAMGLWNYFNEESAFSDELSDKTRMTAQAATSLLLVGGAMAGVEVTPFYGKFTFATSQLIHFSVVLNGGLGAGSTRHMLKPSNSAGPATYGSTGWRMMAEIGGGFRVKFAEHFSVRLELRDIMYSATVSSVNGCTAAQLAGPTPTCPTLSDTDATIARALVMSPSSDVLNNLGLYFGGSVDF